MQKAHRGELWLIDLGMVQKTRSCLILSINFLDHERAVVTSGRTTRSHARAASISSTRRKR